MIHITNGDATKALIEQAGLGGNCSNWCDVLYEGPVPADVSERELREIRARFLSDRQSSVFERIRGGLERGQAVLDERSPDQELVLWFEHDLFDQLNLIHLLDRLAASPAANVRTSLSCIDRFPGHPAFKGLGELPPADLTALADSRRPATSEQCTAARLAWAAFRSPDPRAIETVINQGGSALPFLGAALQRHLEEFPSTTNGLSRSESRLLELIAGGIVDTWAAFPRMHEGETSYYITDSSLWNLIVNLAPLVATEGDIHGSGALPHATLAITTAGREALEGRLDRVEVFGIDRWLGGVHLDGANACWRWNTATRQVDRKPPRS